MTGKNNHTAVVKTPAVSTKVGTMQSSTSRSPPKRSKQKRVIITPGINQFPEAHVHSMEIKANMLGARGLRQAGETEILEDVLNNSVTDMQAVPTSYEMEITKEGTVNQFSYLSGTADDAPCFDFGLRIPSLIKKPADPKPILDQDGIASGVEKVSMDVKNVLGVPFDIHVVQYQAEDADPTVSTGPMQILKRTVPADGTVNIGYRMPGPGQSPVIDIVAVEGDGSVPKPFKYARIMHCYRVFIVLPRDIYTDQEFNTQDVVAVVKVKGMVHGMSFMNALNYIGVGKVDVSTVISRGVVNKVKVKDFKDFPVRNFTPAASSPSSTNDGAYIRAVASKSKGTYNYVLYGKNGKVIQMPNKFDNCRVRITGYAGFILDGKVFQDFTVMAGVAYVSIPGPGLSVFSSTDYQAFKDTNPIFMAGSQIVFVQGRDFEIVDAEGQISTNVGGFFGSVYSVFKGAIGTAIKIGTVASTISRLFL